MLNGLDVIGPKMRRLVEEAERILETHAGGKSDGVLLHCWRGGMRSGSVAWLLEFFGHRVATLEGGYKAFRQHVLRAFAVPRNVTLLSGPTGSGKTDVLKALREQGEQMLDLEGLAHHKGSVFGGLGEPPQPSQEQFRKPFSYSLAQPRPRAARVDRRREPPDRVSACAARDYGPDGLGAGGLPGRPRRRPRSAFGGNLRRLLCRAACRRGRRHPQAPGRATHAADYRSDSGGRPRGGLHPSLVLLRPHLRPCSTRRTPLFTATLATDLSDVGLVAAKAQAVAERMQASSRVEVA